ncbi:2-oxoglutarate dehydrogenase complex dihydrolipoyllysine-residue succinyltransferase [Nannocystaceae bacterium ST9]
MPTQIVVPPLGESITEGVISTWLLGVGDSVQVDQPIVEIETDKITVEVPSPIAGVLTQQLVALGARVTIGEPIAVVDASASASAQAQARVTADAAAQVAVVAASEPPPASKPAAEPMPAARAEAGRTGVDLGAVEGSGRGGRILKEDVQRAAAQTPAPVAAAPIAAPTPAAKPAAAAPSPKPAPTPTPARTPGEREQRVPMSPLRKRIAERLVEAQQTAAILTTFNEVDMSALMDLRKQYKDEFLEKHQAKLGFMSAFVKACTSALQQFPAVNAEVQDDAIVYKHYYDIGVAVGGGKGLVVPVVRNADQLSFAAIENEIARLAGLARDNKLALGDLTGGTFTISNGGIYGSMLSTPILNPPQSGILGLHNIVERPIAVKGQVVIRPIMYLALSYDHRIVDGREAVQFLVHVKQAIEDPRRLLLGL